MTPATFNADAFADAVNAHDADRVAEFYAEDATLSRSTFPEPIRGRDEIRKRYTGFFNAFEDLHTQTREEVVGDKETAALAHVTGTNTNDFPVPGTGASLPATGNRVEYDMGVFFTLNEEGLIAEDVGIFDVATFMEQLGIRVGDLPQARGSA
jgi:steroid delta-isomerase-like uncharacterized protein